MNTRANELIQALEIVSSRVQEIKEAFDEIESKCLEMQEVCSEINEDVSMLKNQLIELSMKNKG